MGKCGLFAFGANESSACMCLYQKCSSCSEISFQQNTVCTPEKEKEGLLIPVKNIRWFVATTLMFYT